MNFSNKINTCIEKLKSFSIRQLKEDIKNAVIDAFHPYDVEVWETGFSDKVFDIYIYMSEKTRYRYPFDTFIWDVESGKDKGGVDNRTTDNKLDYKSALLEVSKKFPGIYLKAIKDSPDHYRNKTEL